MPIFFKAPPKPVNSCPLKWVKLIKISEITVLADYFVICTANSTTQIKSLCDQVEAKLEELGEPVLHREGYREGGWVLLDYKTDRVEDPAAFVARYAPQLRLYAQALGEITALPVREMWLYAVGNGQAYPVPPGDAPETDHGRFAGI